MTHSPKTRKDAPKPRGRPRSGSEVRLPYVVRLEPTVAQRLREHGAGSLATGIHRLAERLRS